MTDSLEDRIYSYLTHGYDKNGINWHDGMDRAREVLNNMSNAEFLELLSGTISDMLAYKQDAT